MTNETEMREAWKASHSAQKQSNYGRYKASVRRGEGMNLQIVTITANTAELALEVANLVEQASARLGNGDAKPVEVEELAKLVVTLFNDCTEKQYSIDLETEVAPYIAQGIIDKYNVSKKE